MAEDGIELGQRLSHDVGGHGRERLVAGLQADLADADAPRSKPARAALDRLAHRGHGVDAPDECLAILGDSLGEAGVVAVAVAELPVQRQPASAFGAGGELAKEDGLAGATQPDKRPVGVERGASNSQSSYAASSRSRPARYGGGTPLPGRNGLGSGFGCRASPELSIFE